MQFWWVNQNQTFEQEVRGGYLWSPKRRADGAINPFYESMREVAPGDLIFSFQESRICALGIASSYARESPKPSEFGKVGSNWSDIGWRVDVSFTMLTNQVRPAEHIHRLRPFLPERYSPLQESGRGNQNMYLTWVKKDLADELLKLVGAEAHQMWQRAAEQQDYVLKTPDDVETWEDHVVQVIRNDTQIPETERKALVTARRGQGLFKQRVRAFEHACRVTKVDRPEHLVASHCKPWRDSSNDERLDGENGLLLTPTIDHLFDRGFISFDDDGTLLISPVAHRPSLQRMAIPIDKTFNVGTFSAGQRLYLDFHRNSVFLLARVRS